MKLTSLSKNSLIAKRKNRKGSKKRRSSQKKKTKGSKGGNDEQSSDKPTKGRSSPAPHRVAIAESALLLNPNSTAYNQTISTSARRSTSIRIQRLSVDPSGKKVVQSYHSFQDLQSESTKPSLRVTSLQAQTSGLSKCVSSDQLSSTSILPSPRPTATVRVAKPRNILTPDPHPSESPRDVDPNYYKATSVMEAVREYKHRSALPLSPLHENGVVVEVLAGSLVLLAGLHLGIG